MRSLLLCIFLLLPNLGWARGLRGNPPDLGMSVQELFGKWLRAAGGEAAWKALIDIKFDLTGTTKFAGLTVEKRVRHVHIKLQPRLRIKMEYVDGDNKRVIFGLDGEGWFKYKEDIPIGKGRWDWRKPDVYDDFKSQDEVSYELKGIGFWLGIPFLLQQPGARLRFAGFLKPLNDGDKPLPIVEVDLSDVGDWPIDMVIVALDPNDWQPVEARYRFRGEEKMPYTCVFFEFDQTLGVKYPKVRVFYDDTKGNAEREELMENVVANTWIHQDEFDRPRAQEHWRKRR